MRAPAESAELVLAALLELAPSGVEQVDGEGVVELAVYGAPGELPELSEGDAEVGGVRVSVSASEVDDDWEERWKRFHVPVLVKGTRAIRHPCQIPQGTRGIGHPSQIPQGTRGIGHPSQIPQGTPRIRHPRQIPPESLYVRPPWERAARPPGSIDLVIDPGRAFGTGSHPTTRLSLELLVGLGQRAGSLCDLGCGSGVLSIAAARLGFRPVSALDSDPLAVEATAANARANGVVLQRVERFDLRSRSAPAADVVLANLMRPLLLRVAELMEAQPRTLIASGLLDDEADEVAAAFAPLRERLRLSEGGWSALLLEG